MTKTWQPYARHILDCVARIRQIEKRGDLRQDPVLYDATLRNLQTLSEATQRLPQDLKADFDTIPWNAISGFRNILVHNYLGDVDPEVVYRIVQDYVPSLADAVSAMLDKSRDARK